STPLPLACSRGQLQAVREREAIPLAHGGAALLDLPTNVQVCSALRCQELAPPALQELSALAVLHQSGGCFALGSGKVQLETQWCRLRYRSPIAFGSGGYRL